MKKVITYGTYDLLHRGHVRLLERARELGDYLVVGVTADSFDRGRGKINVVQSLAERMEAVRATGLADEIIVEEYEGRRSMTFNAWESMFLLSDRIGAASSITFPITARLYILIAPRVCRAVRYAQNALLWTSGLLAPDK